jgi:hypothetical protein
VFDVVAPHDGRPAGRHHAPQPHLPSRPPAWESRREEAPPTARRPCRPPPHHGPRYHRRASPAAPPLSHPRCHRTGPAQHTQPRCGSIIHPYRKHTDMIPDRAVTLRERTPRSTTGVIFHAGRVPQESAAPALGRSGQCRRRPTHAVPDRHPHRRCAQLSRPDSVVDPGIPTRARTFDRIGMEVAGWPVERTDPEPARVPDAGEHRPCARRRRPTARTAPPRPRERPGHRPAARRAPRRRCRTGAGLRPCGHGIA